MNAVTTPTCSMDGAMTTLPMTSAATSSRAPKAALAGIRYLLSGPMNMRTMCGATSPTKPMRPVKLTTTAEIRATRSIEIILSFPASTPMALALSSPVARRLSFPEISWADTMPITTTTATKGISVQDARDSEPTCHWYTSSRLFGSAHSIISVVNALKMYITAIPDMIMTVGDVFFICDTAMMTSVGMSEKRKAFITMAYFPAATVAPRVMAMVAPKDAPEDTPVV